MRREGRGGRKRKGGKEKKKKTRSEIIIASWRVAHLLHFPHFPFPTGKALRCHVTWQNVEVAAAHMTGVPYTKIRIHGFVSRSLFWFPVGRAISVSAPRGCRRQAHPRVHRLSESGSL